MAPAILCRHACRSSAAVTFRLRVLGWFSAPLSLFAAQCSVLSEVLHLHNTLCIALSDQTMRTFQIPDSEGGIQQILRLPSVQSRRQLNELPDFASHSPRKSTESPGVLAGCNCAKIDSPGSCINSPTVNCHGVGLISSTRAPSHHCCTEYAQDTSPSCPCEVARGVQYWRP
jgi:hypothetical protein